MDITLVVAIVAIIMPPAFIGLLHGLLQVCPRGAVWVILFVRRLFGSRLKWQLLRVFHFQINESNNDN